MRLSVSNLDAYRRYRDNEDVTLESLLSQLRRESPPSRAMLAGKAFHSILETADVSELDAAERDGFKFRFSLDCAIALPHVRELKAEVQLETPSGPVTLVGIVDGMDAAIHDYKLTARFDAEKYADSYQWRCYLTMFGGTKFIYDVFVGKDDEDEWVVFDYHALPFYAYPAMQSDVLREVSEFAAFVAKHLPEQA